MNTELIEQLKFLVEEVAEIDAKLKAIDELLGAHGAELNEMALSAIVDDTIRLQMMRRDIVKWASRAFAKDFTDTIRKAMGLHNVSAFGKRSE